MSHPVGGGSALHIQTMRAPQRVGVLAVVVAGAGSPVAAQSLAAGDSLLAAGDTAGAIAAYEAVVERDWGNAEARYRAGVLRFARFRPGDAVSEDRRLAAEHLRLATRLQGDSVKYWLALADVYRSETEVTVRLQVPGLVRRAWERARHDPALRAEAEYRLGRIEWERYEHFAHRYLFSGDVHVVDHGGLMSDWARAELLLQHLRPDPGDPGAQYRITAERHLRAALDVEPGHVPAAGLLAVLLGEHGRWEEAHELARTVTRAAPDSGQAWALLGMVLTRLGRWREAERALERGLAQMAASDRQPYDEVDLILRRTDVQQLRRLPAAERARATELYWNASDPLYLTNVNEPRLEFFTRLTYVIHRWSDPLRGYAGYESDRGAVYVRYGPPDVWATLGRGRSSQQRAPPAPIEGFLLKDGRLRAAELQLPPPDDAVGSLEHEWNTVLWLYREPQLRFVFSMTPGYAVARFSSDFRAWYRQAEQLVPVRWDNVPAVASLDTIGVQAVQFRGQAGERTDLGVFAFIPVERLRRGTDLAEQPMEAAVIIKDREFADIVRVPRVERLRAGVEAAGRRSWRLEMRPGEYVMRVEAWLPAVQRAARSSARIAIRRFGRDSLQLSDVLLAERAEPLDSTPTRWTEFLLVPSAGRFARGEPFTLLWEVYNLAPDSTGTARYRVGLWITVQDIERATPVARVIGGVLDAIGLTAKGDDRVALEYDRDVAVAEGGVVVEHLVIDLQSAQAATYDVTLVVHDRVADRTAEISRRFTVTDQPLER